MLDFWVHRNLPKVNTAARFFWQAYCFGQTVLLSIQMNKVICLNSKPESKQSGFGEERAALKSELLRFSGIFNPLNLFIYLIYTPLSFSTRTPSGLHCSPLLHFSLTPRLRVRGVSKITLWASTGGQGFEPGLPKSGSTFGESVDWHFFLSCTTF